jgi:hypothetical protein
MGVYAVPLGGAPRACERPSQGVVDDLLQGFAPPMHFVLDHSGDIRVEGQSRAHEAS